MRKETTLGADFFGLNFDANKMLDALKSAGFVLDESSEIPKFTGQFYQYKNEDGSIRFVQETGE